MSNTVDQTVKTDYYARRSAEHYSLIAQLVEQRTVNPFVAGSSPARGAKLRALHRNMWGFFVLSSLLPYCYLMLILSKIGWFKRLLVDS